MIIFFFILQFISVFVGISLIAMGLRGRLKLGDPRCVKCSYDLRTFGERPSKCSECGADLTVPGSVCYAERDRKPVLAYVGAILIIIGIVVPLVLILVMTLGAPTLAPTMPQRVDAKEAAMMSDAQLIGSISANFNNPKLWNEIQLRTVHRNLSKEEIAAVVAEIIQHIQRSESDDRIVGLSRMEPFVKLIIADKLISESSLQSLLLSVYPDEVEIPKLNRVEQSQYSLGLDIEYPRQPRRFDIETVLVIRSVKIAGQEQSIQHGGQSHYIGSTDDGKVISLFQGDPLVNISLPELEVGNHDVVIDLEWAAFAPDATKDLPVLWRQYPEKWPEPLYRQRRAIKKNLEVVSQGALPLNLVDDPDLKEAINSAIMVTGVTIMPALDNDGLVARVGLAHGIVPHLDYAFEVELEVEGFPVVYPKVSEYLISITDGRKSIEPEFLGLHNWINEFKLPASATGQEQINIHLIPVTNNVVDWINDHGGQVLPSQVDQLWSEEMIFRNVPKRIVENDRE